jgi:hypothetical protein
MKNFKQKQYTSKSGTTYTFQFPGIRSVTKINDRIKNKHGIPQDEKLADEMLEHVIVNPKMKMDDFSSIREFNEVVQEAYKFVNGLDEQTEDSFRQEEGGAGEG